MPLIANLLQRNPVKYYPQPIDSYSHTFISKKCCISYIQKFMNNQPFDPAFDNYKQQLFVIFTYYCGFGDRQNYSKLKIQNFKRLLEDAQVLKSNRSQIHFDLIYSGSNKNSGIDFDTFLGIVPTLVKQDNGYIDKNDVKSLVYQNFHALYDYLIEQTDLGIQIGFIRKQSFTEECFMLLKQFTQTLLKIYAHYFDPKATKAKKQRAEIFQILCEFMKKFQITPYLTSKLFGYMALDFLLTEKSENIYKQWFKYDDVKSFSPFTFFMFLKFIILLSSVAYKKICELNLSPVRKLAVLLQRFQVSKGFISLCKTQKINVHLLATQAQIKKIEKKTEVTLDSKTNSPMKQKTSEKLTPQYKSALQQKFLSFCCHGETLPKTSLTHKKTHKIIKSLTPASKKQSVEIMISSQTNNKNVEFKDFLMLLDNMAKKQKVSFFDKLSAFLSLESPIVESRFNEVVNFGVTRQNFENCAEMIEYLSAPQQFLDRIFRTYSQTKNRYLSLDIANYIQILHDFQLTPHFITKNDGINIYEESVENGEMREFGFKNFKSSFLALLRQIHSIGQNDQSIEKKLVIVFERMNESRGKKHINKVCEGYGRQDYLVNFRDHFKYVYHPNKQIELTNHEKLRLYLQ